MWNASFRAAKLENIATTDSFVIPETLLQKLITISKDKKIEIGAYLDKKGNIVGTVFEGTESEVNMGDPERGFMRHIHTILQKGNICHHREAIS